MIRFIIVIGLAFAFQSCATIFSGSKQMVHIASKPDSAKIEMNGILVGYTPADVWMKKQLDKPLITLTRKGYQTKTFQLQSSVDPVTFINLLFLIGFVVDLATGAIMKYDPITYTIEMDANR